MGSGQGSYDQGLVSSCQGSYDQGLVGSGQGNMAPYRVAAPGFRVLTMKDDDHRGGAQCKCLSR